jgi:arsenical-resistance protein
MKKRLGFLDRFLTLWIFIAMLIGVGIGYFIPNSADFINSFSSGTTNIPLAIGLILMMYPPLTKIDFSQVPKMFEKPKLLTVSFFITWIVGPFLMFLLATFFLKEYPEYMTGLIIIGIAPCIAMVIVWNELAEGNRELTAGLIGINSLLQVFFFSLYAYFYLEIMLPLFGIKGLELNITIAEIAKTVGIYLGIPFALAVISRFFIKKYVGDKWFNQKFIPFVSTYRLPIQVASIIALVAGVYFQGVIANETKWQDKIADLQKQIAEAEVKSKETNVVVQEKIVTKTKIIKEKGQDIVNYIDREVVKKEEIIKYIEQCPVPKEIIDLHNQAADLNKAVDGKK